MPLASTGLYSVTLNQTYQTQPVRNVFNYIEAGRLDDLQAELAVAWDSAIVPALATIQGTTVKYINVTVDNISGTLAETVITPSAAAGGVAGTDMAAYIAAPYKYQRFQTDTRNGSKRFCGMVEENVQTDVPTAAYLLTMQAIEATLAQTFVTLGGSFSPIVLRIPEVSPGTWRYADVDSVVALNRITTQNSRKRW